MVPVVLIECKEVLYVTLLTGISVSPRRDISDQLTSKRGGNTKPLIELSNRSSMSANCCTAF